MDRANEHVDTIENRIRTRYFPAMDRLSFEQFAPTFHPDARLAFVRDGSVQYLTLAQWRARLDGIRADADHYLHRERGDHRIVAVAVMGTIGRAELRMTYPTAEYTDYLQLAHHDGHWLIVAKLFHVEAR